MHTSLKVRHNIVIYCSAQNTHETGLTFALRSVFCVGLWNTTATRCFAWSYYFPMLCHTTNLLTRKIKICEPQSKNIPPRIYPTAYVTLHTSTSLTQVKNPMRCFARHFPSARKGNVPFNLNYVVKNIHRIVTFLCETEHFIRSY
jgi:hypothetical protein